MVSKEPNKDVITNFRRVLFRTIEEGNLLASKLSKVCLNPEKIEFGLFELFINAVEHGNLDIGYEAKSKFLENDDFENEINHRMSLAEYKHRKVLVEVEQYGKYIQFIIHDEGKGFECEKYFSIDNARTHHKHGRGIAIANNMSFERLEYRGNGNIVVATAIANQAALGG